MTKERYRLNDAAKVAGVSVASVLDFLKKKGYQTHKDRPGHTYVDADHVEEYVQERIAKYKKYGHWGPMSAGAPPSFEPPVRSVPQPLAPAASLEPDEATLITQQLAGIERIVANKEREKERQKEAHARLISLLDSQITELEARYVELSDRLKELRHDHPVV